MVRMVKRRRQRDGGNPCQFIGKDFQSVAGKKSEVGHGILLLCHKSRLFIDILRSKGFRKIDEAI